MVGAANPQAEEEGDVMLNKMGTKLEEEISWLRYERDHLLMEQAIIEAVAEGVFAADPNFHWSELTIQ